MEYQEIRTATVIVGGAATISCINPDGVVEWTEALKPGRHDGKQWLPFMYEGCTLETGGSATVLLDARTRVARIRYGDGSHETGANPDFVVTAASRHERELKRQMAILSARSDKLDKRISALDDLSARREAALAAAAIPQVPDEPVIDTGDIVVDPDEPVREEVAQ